MLERSAGKLARSVLRGPGEREPTWLPGGAAPVRATEEEFTPRCARGRTDQYLERRFSCVLHTRDGSAVGGSWVD
jgi:hypothetical protein